MKNLNFEDLKVTNLSSQELIEVDGGAPTWKQIWNNAYHANWAGAIGGVEDKIKEFFD